MMMEKYNYPNLAAVDAEDAEVILLLECAQYGYIADREEEIAEQEAAMERAQHG